MSRFSRIVKSLKIVKAELRPEDRSVNRYRRLGAPEDAPMVKRTPKKQDHSHEPMYLQEKKKWEDCQAPELRERLQRMKNPKKLQMFIVLAQEHNHRILYLEAIRKVQDLGYNWLVPRVPHISRMMDVIEPGRGREKKPQIRKIRAEKKDSQ